MSVNRCVGDDTVRIRKKSYWVRLIQECLAIENLIGGHKALRQEREERIGDVRKGGTKGRKQNPIQQKLSRRYSPQIGAVTYRIGLGRGANLRLIDTETVRIQLRQADVPIDEDHGIQKRNEPKWAQLVRSSLEFIERQGVHHSPPICQIRRHHCHTTQCGIDEHIKEAFITGIGEYSCAGTRCSEYTAKPDAVSRRKSIRQSQ